MRVIKYLGFSTEGFFLRFWLYYPDITLTRLFMVMKTLVNFKAHNLKVVGSNPTPATIVICTPSLSAWGCSFFGSVPSFSRAASSP